MFTFNVGDKARDTFAVELPDRKSVRGEAIRAAGEILRDIDGALGEEWRMLVNEEDGEFVLELKFSIREKGAS